MIHNDIQNQLQLLIKTSAPPLVEVSQAMLGAEEWVSGQKLTATVLAALPNGRFQTQVGDNVLDMNLPKNTQPGDSIELIFVSNQPRPTFILSRDLAAMPRPDASSANANAPVTLSDTARFLGALLEKASAGQGEGVASPLAKAAPLLAGAPADTQQLSAALKTALSQSGLFYESHQVQWANGERPLTDLLQEPQGRLSTPGQGAASQAQPPGLASLAQQDVPQSKIADTAQATSVQHVVHPDTLPLVQQQLHALDARQLVWQGQVWQGQSMEWTVEERAAREGDSETPPAWQTSLRLSLPQLGDVAANLAFSPQGLRINFKVGETATGQVLQDARGDLLQALEAAGLNVAGMTVAQNEKA